MNKLKKTKGFTLLEIAVVLLIVGLLTGTLLVPLSNQVNQRKIEDTKRILEENKNAVLGYAITKGFLPCPAISENDGNEDRTSGQCTGGKRIGYLPWITLGTQKSDSWGRLLRYSITPTFSRAPVSTVSIADINVRTRDYTSGNLTGIASSVPVMIMSHGPNGYGGYLENGAIISDTSTTNIDEKNNSATTATNTFIYRDLSANTTAPGGEFDDIVTWIPSSILFNRMVAAGQLP
jgi:prepilin-type N-terminal cleavage/methylation domain-containing protein